MEWEDFGPCASRFPLGSAFRGGEEENVTSARKQKSGNIYFFCKRDHRKMTSVFNYHYVQDYVGINPVRKGEGENCK